MASNPPDKEAATSQEPFSYQNRHSTVRPNTNITIRIPKTPDEVKEILKHSDHKARDLIGSSLKAHRNPYEAMIFLYGLSGAGKSSTLNHLFNSKLIPTSENKSSTPEIIEYVATMDSTHWGISGLDIGFIDTPGWGDTDGGCVRNLANIEQFLLSHPYLDSKYLFYKLYPNLVMIIARAGDPRMLGINSQLSRMLRVLSKLNIVDKTCPNVIVALTCAIFIRPPRKYVEKKDLLILTIKNLVRLHLGVDPPVVVIENLADEEELEKDGDWTLLPDGTKQPLNLFEEMISLMRASGDEIGVEAVRLLFNNNRTKLENFVCRKMDSKGDFFMDIPPNIKKWEKIISNEFEPLIDTELFKAIVSCIEEKRLPYLSSLTYEMVMPLLHRLQEVNLTKYSEINSLNIEQINQMLIPFRLNKQEKILLFELFNVKPLENLRYVDMLGCGYNPQYGVKGRIISSGELKYSYEIGTHIPEMSQFVSKGRLLIHSQFEWARQSIMSSKKPIVKFSAEYELFTLNIDFQSVTFEKIETAFVKAANTLPKYESGNKAIIKAYNSFFAKYGTKCLLSLSFGGSLCGSIDLPFDSENFETETYRVTCLLRIFFENLQKGTNLTRLDFAAIIDANSSVLLEKLCTLPITWLGGEERFQASTLKDLSPIFWGCWVESLCHKFVMLSNISKVCKISRCVSKFKAENAVSIDKFIEENTRTMITEPQILPVFENPEKIDWDLSQSKQIPKSPVVNRNSASARAASETNQLRCVFI